MQETITPIEDTNDSISSVSKHHTFSYKIKLLILASFVVIVSFSIFIPYSKKQQPFDTSEENQVATTSNTTTASISTSSPLNTSQSDNKLSMDCVTEQNVQQTEALEKLRQNAPIQFYMRETENQEGSNQASSPSVMPDSHQTVNGINNSMPATSFNLVTSNTSMAKATRIAHPEYTLSQGSFILGVLETAIHSDLPGMVRAIVSHDVYADQGKRILISKGSRIIGQYNNQIQQGKNRIFVVWQRLIRPDGINIIFTGSGTDPLGQGGMQGNTVNTHFLERFGQATLLSLIGTGVATMGVSSNDLDNSMSAYREVVSSNFNQTANHSFESNGNFCPTIHVNQGEKINVLVAQDLDFYDVLTNKSIIQG